MVEGFGVTPIDYRSSSVEEYVAASTEGKGFDIVYDTVGGATLDSSFVAAKRYTGHVVSCLGRGSHSLALLFSGSQLLGRVYPSSPDYRREPSASWQNTRASSSSR